MHRTILLLLLAVITVGMGGCADHDKAMAGAAVEAPDGKPMAPAPANPLPTPVGRSLQAPGPQDTIVQIGDVLEVIVAEDRSFDGYYEVRRGGYIILPSVGRIDASSLTLKEVEAKVSKALEDTQLTRATVKVKKLGESHNGREQ